MPCPHATPRLGCTSAPFAQDAIARHADSEALRLFQESLMKMHEQRLAVEMEAQTQAAIRTELARLARLSELEREVEAARRHVEGLLTLKCPRPDCQQVQSEVESCGCCTMGICMCVVLCVRRGWTMTAAAP